MKDIDYMKISERVIAGIQKGAFLTVRDENYVNRILEVSIKPRVICGLKSWPLCPFYASF